MLNKIKQLREMTGAGMLDVKKALEHSGGDLEKAAEWLRKNGIAKAAKKAGNIAAEGMVYSLISEDGKHGIIVEVNSQTDFVAKNENFIHFVHNLAHTLLHSNFDAHKSIDDLKKHKKVGNHTIEESEVELTAKIGEKISFRRFHKLSSHEIGNYNHTNGRISVLVGGEGISKQVLKDIAMHAAANAPKFLSVSSVDKHFIEKETEILREQYSKSMAGKPANILENIIKGAVNKQIMETVLEEQPFLKDPSKKVKDLLHGGKLTYYIRFEVGEGIEKQESNFAEEVRKAAQGN